VSISLATPTISDAGIAQIRRISKRYVALVRKSMGSQTPRISDVSLMLTIVHCANSLKLDRLEKFDDFNLVHDVAGLWRHALPDGTITNCFWPRCGGGKS
jgi:hypothetical protein